MSNTHLLRTLNHFLYQSPYTALEITFGQHQIQNQQNGQLLHTVHKQQSRLVINKLPNPGLAQMVVVDNLLFNFSFLFLKPSKPLHYKSAMLQLPRPLDRGQLQIAPNALCLSFRIDAPDPALSVHVAHWYQGTCTFERFREPYASHAL
ncbi:MULTISPECIES: hypothetical protein [Flavobacteriaceae]|uniref:hypothetical protein n=1 Tax=Flavobacteriaceae TaxID=49546 RepID=UPI0014925BD5|nr:MULTISPECIES: hypothetical protein [Allomuricauda]MDC6365557.1 hypothetical protein [Muricauda sp. AC10]